MPDSTAGVALAVPNRERMAYLTHLAGRLPAGLSASYSYRGHEIVMHVVAVAAVGNRTNALPVAAVTVGCRYARGAWWFVGGDDRAPFAAANNLREAATVIVRELNDQIRQREAVR
ncbi:hypothetical protein EBO15_23915 [Actinomadura harenae]|uniref:Uncharacterized protein n=1 Tax=Actinomadura harenae TaxID=2483351 RepID=A0A3M2LVP2_9ACTN|nr:hypothetical protein EBO15_23915 [Actinomadura harenae]